MVILQNQAPANTETQTDQNETAANVEATANAEPASKAAPESVEKAEAGVLRQSFCILQDCIVPICHKRVGSFLEEHKYGIMESLRDPCCQHKHEPVAVKTFKHYLAKDVTRSHAGNAEDIRETGMAERNACAEKRVSPLNMRANPARSKKTNQQKISNILPQRRHLRSSYKSLTGNCGDKVAIQAIGLQQKA